MRGEQESNLNELLNERRKKIKDHIENVLKSPDGDIYNATDPDIDSIKDTDSLVKYLNSKYDFLSYKHDSSQGINLYKDGDSLVRDKRNNSEESVTTVYSDQIYLFNLMRAAIIFNEHSNLNALDIKVIKKTLEEINNLASFTEPTDKEKTFLQIHNKIKNNYLLRKTDEDITLALAYVELQNTHYNVSTITNDRVISSLKLKGLYNALKNKLQELQAKTDLESFSDFIAKKSAEIILNSNEVKVIHTSLSKIIPALTDAYEDTYYQVNNSILEEVSKTHRTIDQSLLNRSYFSPHRIANSFKSTLNKKTSATDLEKAGKRLDEASKEFKKNMEKGLNNGQLQLSLKESLDARRESVNQHINTVLAKKHINTILNPQIHDPHKPDPHKPNPQIHNPEIPDLNSATDPKQYLNQMVDYCATQYDLKQGIHRYIDGDSLIRDARDQTNNNWYSENESISKEVDKWAEKIQFYNAIRAAIAFMEYHGHTCTASDIKILCETALEGYTIEKLNAMIVTFVNVTARNNLKIPAGEEPTKHITESIGKLIHYTGLMDKHYNVSTLMKTSDNKEFVVSSLKLQGFNQAVKNRLEELSKKDHPETIDDFIAKKTSELILNYSKELKVIPTQFSKLVPGLRNAYEESTYEVINNHIDKGSLLFTGYRSGSPAFLGNDQEKNTQNAVDTFQEQVGGKVLLNSLMTANKRAPDELAAHKLIDDITNNNTDILKAYTPVNMAKRLQKQDVKAFNDILTLVNTHENKIRESTDEDVKNAFKNIQLCSSYISNKDVKNYYFPAAMRQLIHDIKRGCLNIFFTEGEKNKIPDALLFCKSGKDRTGIGSIINTDYVISKDNEQVTVNSGHQQILTGMNGGTPGAYGIKSDPFLNPPQMPDVYLDLGLERDTSMGNLFKPKKNGMFTENKTAKELTNQMSIRNAGLSPRLSTENEEEKQDTYLEPSIRPLPIKPRNTTERSTENSPIQKREEKVRDALHSFFGNDGTVEELTIQNNDKASLDDLIKDSLIAYDESQGITRYIKDDCLIRDAREQKIPPDNSHEIHALHAQCYNFCRAAKLVLEFNRAKNTEVDDSIITAIPCTVNTKEGADNVKREIIWSIADRLEKKKNKKTYNEISAQMNVAIHCATLDDQSYNISTIMKIPSDQGHAEKTIIQSDVKVKGFNEELLSIFRNILSFNDTDLEEIRYNWYNNLDNFNKFIARKACKKILDSYNEEKGEFPVIPNQLSDIIPGLKNAYSEITYVKDDNNDIKIITQSYRSSLPKIVATEALKSFYSDIGTKEIYLNSLINNNEEEHLSNISAIRTQNFTLIKSSDKVNPHSFNTVLKRIACGSLKEIITPEAKSFIEKDIEPNGQSLELQDNLVKVNVNPDVKKAIQTLVECRKLMNEKAKLIFHGSLNNNELTNKIQMVMYDIQHGALRNYLPKSLENRAILSFCESGSNRTGAVFQGLIDQALMRSIGKDRESEIRKVTIKGGQQGFIADGSGGTTGALGMKNTGDLKELVNDISTYGSPKYSSPSKTKKHKKDKKQMNNRENKTITNSVSSETSENTINTNENKSILSYIYDIVSGPVKDVTTGFGINTEKEGKNLNVNELNISTDSLLKEKEKEKEKESENNEQLEKELEELESDSNKSSIFSFKSVNQNSKQNIPSSESTIDSQDDKSLFTALENNTNFSNNSAFLSTSSNDDNGDNESVISDITEENNKFLQNTSTLNLSTLNPSDPSFYPAYLNLPDTNNDQNITSHASSIKARHDIEKDDMSINSNSSKNKNLEDEFNMKQDLLRQSSNRIQVNTKGRIINHNEYNPEEEKKSDTSTQDLNNRNSSENESEEEIYGSTSDFFNGRTRHNTNETYPDLTQDNLNIHNNNTRSQTTISNYESSDSQTSEKQDDVTPLLNKTKSDKKPTIYSYLSTALTRVSGLPSLALRGFRSNVNNTQTIEENISPIVDITELNNSEIDDTDISLDKDSVDHTNNPLIITDISAIQRGSDEGLTSNRSDSSISGDNSDTSSSVSSHISNTPSSGYNIFNFNFNNLLPKYENPLNIFKNLNIFKPKSNITSSEAFTIPKKELRDDINDLKYPDQEDKKSYLSSIYNAFAFPFNKLASTALNKKSKHVDNELTASQPQVTHQGVQQENEEVRQPLETSSITDNHIKLMNELTDKFKQKNSLEENTLPEAQPKPSPVVLRKKGLNNFIKKFLTNQINEYNPVYPKEIALKDLIDYHTTQYDREQGIIRYIDGDNLIRDARVQSIPDNNSHEYHAWQAQCYNFCRAAQLVLSHNNPQYLKQALMTKIEDVDIVTNKESADNFKRSLVWFIADHSDQDHTEGVYNKIAKQLDTAINCSVIDDKSYNVATVMYINNTTVVQSDVKVKGFNEKLLEVFQKIAHLENNDKPEPEGPLYEWYHKHNDFNKFIAREACKKIVSSYNEQGYFPVIPNQLRAIIPGLKNAYLESVDVMDDDNIKTIMQSYRSTLPAYKQDQVLTTEALNSFKEDTGAENIYLTSLVTGNEQKGPGTLTKILNKDGSLKLIQSPLNLVRNFGTRDFNPFNTVLKEIANSLDGIITPEAKAFIETDRKSPGQSLILKKLKNNFVKKEVTVDQDVKKDGSVDPDVEKAIKTLIECRELMNRKIRWRFYGSLDNHNLANKIQMVMYDIQHGALKDYLPNILKNTEILTFCKSGKDRTGSDFQNLIDQVLVRLFGKTYEAVIMDATIKAGQQAYLAGAGGGTTAAFGIKNDGGLHARKEYVKAMPTALATYGNRTPKYKKEIDSFEHIDIGEEQENSSELTKENLESRSQPFNQRSNDDGISSLTEDLVESQPENKAGTIPKFTSRLPSFFTNPLRRNARVVPENEEENNTLFKQTNTLVTRKKDVLNGRNKINGIVNDEYSESSSNNSYNISDSDDESSVNTTTDVIRPQETFYLGTKKDGDLYSDNESVSSYDRRLTSPSSLDNNRTNRNDNFDLEDELSTTSNNSTTRNIDRSIKVGIDGQVNQTPQHNNLTPTIRPIARQQTENGINTTTTPYIPIYNPTAPQNQTLQNNLTPTIVPIHPEIPIHNPTTPEHQQPQYQPQENQTQQNTIPHIQQPQNQQPTFQQQNQPQDNRPPSPRSIADYDDDFYDDFDRYPPYPPMPQHNPPPPTQSLTTNQIAMAILFCLALTLLFGGLGLILGIGISAVVIEQSKPDVNIPPPMYDYRERRGRGRGREHDIEHTQMPQQEQQQHIYQNNAPAKPSIASRVASGVYNMFKKPFSKKEEIPVDIIHTQENSNANINRNRNIKNDHTRTLQEKRTREQNSHRGM